MNKLVQKNEKRLFSGKPKTVQEIMQERLELLPNVIKIFNYASLSISAIYNSLYHPAALDELGTYSKGLQEGTTRLIYAGMFSVIPELHEIWHDVPLLESVTKKNDLFRMFGYSFNKLKELDRKNNYVNIKVDHIDIEAVSMFAPYAVHTHFEVPYILRALGMGTESLTLGLAAFHTLMEDGRAMSFDTNGIVKNKKLNKNKIIDLFPSTNLGLRLVIGIETLLEEPELFFKRGRKSTTEKDALINELEKGFFLNEDSIAIKDLMTAFSKGQSLNIFVKKLERLSLLSKSPAIYNKISPYDIDNLVRSVIEVKIADKISEVINVHTLMEGNHYEGSLESNSLLHFSVLLNTYKSLRNIKKIQIIADSLDIVMEKYKEILSLKIQEINNMLILENQDVNFPYKLQRFFEEKFLPMQKKFDSINEYVVKKSTSSIVELINNF